MCSDTPFICPILVNTISQEWLEIICSNLLQTLSWTQGWTDSILVVKGQRWRSLWPLMSHFERILSNLAQIFTCGLRLDYLVKGHVVLNSAFRQLPHIWTQYIKNKLLFSRYFGLFVKMFFWHVGDLCRVEPGWESPWWRRDCLNTSLLLWGTAEPPGRRQLTTTQLHHPIVTRTMFPPRTCFF